MHPVSVRAIAPVPFECKFRIDNDGWRAVAEGLDIAVHADSFEDAKRSMEAALNEYVQSLVRKSYTVTGKTAA